MTRLGLPRRGRVAAVACLLLAVAMAVPTAAEVVFSKRSLYRNLSVTREGERVCLRFAGVRDDLAQSCIDRGDPQRLVFDYTKRVFAGLLLRPQPTRVLVVGLGGGSIPGAMHALVPAARIDVVEIDPAVQEVADKYFGFRASAGVDIIIRDARVFVKHALLAKVRYDYIVLDAFNGDYIPEHLMTREFLEECRGLLMPGGVLVANTFSRSRLYDSESVTYAAAFGWFLNVKGEESNRIVLTRNAPPVAAAELRRLAAARVAIAADAARFAAHGIDLVAIAGDTTDRADWDPQARVLTDQYSPANLLNQREQR